jgi:hypothetical protein
MYSEEEFHHDDGQAEAQAEAEYDLHIAEGEAAMAEQAAGEAAQAEAENMPESIMPLWTLDKAIDFARDLVNSENPKFKKIGRMMLALKDENLIKACQMSELLLTKLK